MNRFSTLFAYCLPVLCVLFFMLNLAGCTPDPEQTLGIRLQGPVWRIESIEFEASPVPNHDSLIGINYKDSDRLLEVNVSKNGFSRSLSVQNYYEEWRFFAETNPALFRQSIDAFRRDSLCYTLSGGPGEISDYVRQLPGSTDFMTVAIHFPLQTIPENSDFDRAIALRAKLTWLGPDDTPDGFVLASIPNDQEDPDSRFQFTIRAKAIEQTSCENPVNCSSFGISCENGTLLGLDFLCYCACDSGWTGEACEIEICPEPPACVNGIVNLDSCACDCQPGWGGERCDQQITTGNCENSTVSCINGTLVPAEVGPDCECACYPGFAGPACDQPTMREVKTYAGSGVAGNLNGMATQAQFDEPMAIVTDGAGTFYVADAANNQIRQISPDGTVATIAGTGVAGYLDGPAGLALFHAPSGLALDPEGNLYIADRNNHSIRKLDVDGNVTTLTGSSVGHQNGSLASAQFDAPFALYWDLGKQLGNRILLVSEIGSNVIRKIDLDQGAVSTFSGSALGGGSYVNGAALFAQYDQPVALAMDMVGNVYVADMQNHAIRRITHQNGVADQVSTYAGIQPNGNVLGMAANDPYHLPAGIQWEYPNRLYVSDGGNNRIRLLIDNGFGIGIDNTLAGDLANQPGLINGVGIAVRFNQPFGMCQDDQYHLFVAERANHVIREVLP